MILRLFFINFNFLALSAFTAFPLTASAGGVGKTLECFPSYQVNYKLFRHNEAGFINELSLTESTEGVTRSSTGLIDGIAIDLERMNESAAGDFKWQYARLMPAKEHSDRPVDMGFNPVYFESEGKRSLAKIQIQIGHAKSDKFSEGLFTRPLTGLAATRARMASTPYDDLYFSQVTVEVDLTPNNFVEITLPSVHAGLRHIGLECSLR